MKVYHYHRATHAAIYADHEELAFAELERLYPDDANAFELTDVQDVPEPTRG